MKMEKRSSNESRENGSIRQRNSKWGRTGSSEEEQQSRKLGRK